MLPVYQKEDLGGILLCTSATHNFGTDALLLADFAAPRRKDRCLDLCTGCGIIPFLWMRTTDAPVHVTAVDIQPAAIELVTMSRDKNGLADKITPVLQDLREPEPLGHAAWDLVTCNPPYRAPGTGIISQSDSDQIARHETLCTLDDVCRAASYLLRFGGRFCLCQLPERLVDVLASMRQHGIEPKRIRMVQQRASSAPWLVLVEGKRGAKPFVTIEPPLLLEDSPAIYG